MDQNPHNATMMRREITDRVEHIPQIVAEDLAAFIGKLKNILSEGKKQGCFIHADPFTIHFMIIGAFILYKVNQPLREQIVRLQGSVEANLSI